MTFLSYFLLFCIFSCILAILFNHVTEGLTDNLGALFVFVPFWLGGSFGILIAWSFHLKLFWTLIVLIGFAILGPLSFFV